MQSIINNDVEKWVLCHNNIDVFHIVHLPIGSSIETGQEFLEVFETEEQVKNRILEINPNYTEDGTHS